MKKALLEVIVKWLCPTQRSVVTRCCNVAICFMYMCVYIYIYIYIYTHIYIKHIATLQQRVTTDRWVGHSHLTMTSSNAFFILLKMWLNYFWGRGLKNWIIYIGICFATKRFVFVLSEHKCNPSHGRQWVIRIVGGSISIGSPNPVPPVERRIPLEMKTQKHFQKHSTQRIQASAGRAQTRVTVCACSTPGCLGVSVWEL